MSPSADPDTLMSGNMKSKVPKIAFISKGKFGDISVDMLQTPRTHLKRKSTKDSVTFDEIANNTTKQDNSQIKQSASIMSGQIDVSFGNIFSKKKQNPDEKADRDEQDFNVGIGRAPQKKKMIIDKKDGPKTCIPLIK